ncbi:STAS/SEC14 domain-containing protein [Mycolicibacterium vaccae]|uniref:STAS/SEC14 domain-containing protein n=1 Tax=Mycolicibacterium vaccae TaxID=1810 RepID=UPI003D01E2F4
MIEELQDVPAGVVGIRVSGRVTAEDFHGFKPTIDRMLDGDDIRFIEVIEPDYEGFGRGGLLADIKQGFSTLRHLHAFKRTAVVTDKEWIEHAMHAFSWMIPGEVALFRLDELDAAKEWAAKET